MCDCHVLINDLYIYIYTTTTFSGKLAGIHNSRDCKGPINSLHTDNRQTSFHRSFVNRRSLAEAYCERALRRVMLQIAAANFKRSGSPEDITGMPPVSLSGSRRPFQGLPSIYTGNSGIRGRYGTQDNRKRGSACSSSCCEAGLKRVA